MAFEPPADSGGGVTNMRLNDGSPAQQGNRASKIALLGGFERWNPTAASDDNQRSSHQLRRQLTAALRCAEAALQTDPRTAASLQRASCRYLESALQIAGGGA